MTAISEIAARQEVAGLELRGITKAFGQVEVLHGIDLSVRGGEFVVFVGPSGCGKSTLLRLIAGLEEVTDGDILISGHDVTDDDPSVRGIAMVFQSYALYPHMSVAQNMGFGLKMAHRPKEEVARKVNAAADVLQLTPLLDRRPGQLSGGQRQRVAIGRAIVRDPQVFLFDEPLSNLDAELRVEMRMEIARLHRELGNTMIYVTHDQTEAMTLADKIVVLRDGRVEQTGTPAQLYDDPGNVFVAGFIGSPKMNLFPATLRDGAVHIGEDSWPLPSSLRPKENEGAKIVAGVRPEHMRLAGQEEPALPFTVTFPEFLGGTTLLHGHVAGDIPCVIEVERDVSAEMGAVLQITANPGDLRLFDIHGQRLR
ncbi:ABC transporter ATP-binding protein [Roseisalinus antarcticus]|uniref:Maltose/maltodextrin import ATP-binding protein MalK n=1 Tax=Roseisalinus antarcticus TaxID=254357 RepID=A0A1Y5TYH0_9RHOB|nr:sn-glycerol-3-phosphate ABC transporter ATP-binding protein UgpC [Roseisalinus antarcticus]SLN76959.1 Maltose/maltodextrin import ATP-binding protein MalK [Roseisalinus antarcticus]